MPNNPYDVDGNIETFELGNAVTNQNPQGSATGASLYNPYTQQTGYADPYDTRIGNGALPIGIQGTQNRAYTRDVQANETARSQLEGLLADNSLYMQNADLRGRETAANRGLLNSGMAAGNAQRAAIESGLPVALNDSGVYARTASENMGALNERALADLAAQTDRAGFSTNLRIAGMNNAGALQRQRENLAFEGEQRGLDREHEMVRDNFLHQYDLALDDRRTANGIRDYAARTGIDGRAQRSIFFNQLMGEAAANPEVWTPERFAGFINTYMPAYDDFSNWLDEYLGQFFSEDFG